MVLPENIAGRWKGTYRPGRYKGKIVLYKSYIKAICIRCNAEISYGSRGHMTLVSHADTRKHQSAVNAVEGNYRIPGKLAYRLSFLLISNIVQVKIKNLIPCIFLKTVFLPNDVWSVLAPIKTCQSRLLSSILNSTTYAIKDRQSVGRGLFATRHEDRQTILWIRIVTPIISRMWVYELHHRCQ
jgi:hypothetical protein